MMVDTKDLGNPGVPAGEQTSKKNRGPVNQWNFFGVQVSEWLNPGRDDKPFSSFSIGKRYFDSSSETWKTSGSFSAQDLLNLATVAVLAAQSKVKVRSSEGDPSSGRPAESIGIQ